VGGRGRERGERSERWGQTNCSHKECGEWILIQQELQHCRQNLLSEHRLLLETQVGGWREKGRREGGRRNGGKRKGEQEILGMQKATG
jgi:hypothetical protein